MVGGKPLVSQGRCRVDLRVRVPNANTMQAVLKLKPSLFGGLVGIECHGCPGCLHARENGRLRDVDGWASEIRTEELANSFSLVPPLLPVTVHDGCRLLRKPESPRCSWKDEMGRGLRIQ